MTDTLKLNVTQERLEHLNIGVYRRAGKGEIDAMVQMLAHFCIGPSGFLPQVEAEALLDAMSFAELKEAVEGLSGAMQDAAAPKESAS